MTILENLAKYEGEWLNNLREGRGMQLWVDGSLYEGWWSQGKACG